MVSEYLLAMGLLALDVSAYGVVMSADSQGVELLAGRNLVLTSRAQRMRNPLVISRGGGFTGLIGYVGTEEIGGRTTRDWLETFVREHPDKPLPALANGLARGLTEEWTRLGLASVLEIFISGVENGDVRFWYVRNSSGLYDHDWTVKEPSAEFRAVDDLDGNYVPRDRQGGQTKEELLKTRMYSFRMGVLLPAAPVFDAFAEIIGTIYARGIEGFEQVASLDDLAYFARQRMEFLKRLYSADHGVHKTSAAPAPIGGIVHVLGVSRDGEVRQYPKKREQAKTILP